jgi:hypothetical protein
MKETFPVFRKGNILLESDIVRNTNGIWKLVDVPNRTYILIHPVNNAQKEFRGCIAPVTKLSEPGLGLLSRKAFTKLKDLAYKALDNKESVELIVQ